MIDRYALLRIPVPALCVLLASCGGTPPSGCGCPPPPLPLYMAVAERGAGQVAVYPLTSLNANPPAAVTSAAPSFTISAPGANTIMAIGSIYVGEYPNTVAVFTVLHNGSSAVTFSQSASISTGVNDPAAFAVWPFNGTESLFVANRGGNDVAIYKGLDNVPTGFEGTPEATLSGLSAPNGLAYDAKGDLWVSQATNVVEYAAPLAANSAPAATISSGLQSPSAIAFDFTGTMYVADKAKNAIVVYPAGSTSPSVTFTNGISGPSGLYINGSYLYVANETGGDIAEFRLPLDPTSPAIGTNSVDMNQPSALTQLQ